MSNPLSEPIVTKQVLTFDVPSILVEHKDGILPMLTLRQGGSRQVEHVVSVQYYDGAVDEKDQLFVIRAKNQVNFGEHIITVLNDRIEGARPVAPSSPTATEYMSKVGQEIMLKFSCKKTTLFKDDKPVDAFQVVRVKIILP